MYWQIESEPVIYLIVCSLTDWKGRNLVRKLAKQEAGIQLDATNGNSYWAKTKRKVMLHERLYEKQPPVEKPQKLFNLDHKFNS